MSKAYVSVILSWFWELNAKMTNYAQIIVLHSLEWLILFTKWWQQQYK